MRHVSQDPQRQLDLSKYDYFTFAFSLGDADVRYRDGLAVRIGRGSQSIEYRAQPEALSLMPRGWAFVKIPLWGNSTWVKREVNPLNLSRVDWIEVYVSTWGPKLTVWLDDIKFGADPRHIDRELVPDPDRAAAEYIVATKGEADAWVSGKMVKIRTLTDIPGEPFKIINIGYGPATDVTDVGLRLFATLSDCRNIYLPFSSISDEGLKQLTDMPSLTNFYLDVAASISGSGLEKWGSLKNLARLGLRGTSVDDNAIMHIARIPKLEALDLTGTLVTDDGLSHLGSHPTLSSVNAPPRTSEKGLRSLKSLPSGLRYLTVETSACRSGIAFLEGAPLQNVTFVAGATDGRLEPSLLESLELFPELSQLSLVGAIIDGKVTAGIAGLRTVTTLHVGFWRNQATFAEAMKGLNACPRLDSLAIQQETIDREVLLALTTLTRLKSLNINGKLEPKDGLELQVSLPNCKIWVDPPIQKAIDALRRKK